MELKKNSYTKNYSTVLKSRGGHLRRILRDVTLRLLSFNTKVNKDTKCIQFLYFHYIYDDEIKNAEKIIKWLATNFKIISYSEAVERIKNNTIDDYYICFSSDDGLINNKVAARIFKKYDISCCFFINPESIENRDKIFQEAFCKEKLEIPFTNFLTWQEVSQLVEEGHEIGNHTFDHRIQSNLSKKEFIEDLTKSDAILKTKGFNVKHYAYPRGLFKYFSKAYLDYVYKHGYESCATAERGCHIPQDSNKNIENFAIRRDVVVFKEPLSFLRYFMLKSQKSSKQANTFWMDVN
jgi:peptidoglycan/xylan/chitin deacetylase (PgdA/CDA1 family)